MNEALVRRLFSLYLNVIFEPKVCIFSQELKMSISQDQTGLRTFEPKAVDGIFSFNLARVTVKAQDWTFFCVFKETCFFRKSLGTIYYKEASITGFRFSESNTWWSLSTNRAKEGQRWEIELLVRYRRARRSSRGSLDCYPFLLLSLSRPIEMTRLKHRLPIDIHSIFSGSLLG